MIKQEDKNIGYFHELNTDVGENDIDEPINQRIERIVFDFSKHLNKRTTEIKEIISKYIAPTMVRSPIGADYSDGRLMWNGINSIIRKKKTHDWSMEMSRKIPEEASEDEEVRAYTDELISKAFESYIQDGNVYETFISGETNVQLKKALEGVCYTYTHKGRDNPFEVRTLKISQVFLPEYITEWSRTREIFVTFENSWDEFSDMFKNNKNYKKVQDGQLPFNTATFLGERRTQWGIYFNLDKKKEVIIAGSNAIIMSEKNGDQYPHMVRGKAVFPIHKFSGFPTINTHFNVGWGDVLYQSNNLDKINRNNRTYASFASTKNYFMMAVNDDHVDNVEQSIYDAEMKREDGGLPTIVVNAGDGEEKVIQDTVTVSGIPSGLNESMSLDSFIHRDAVETGIRLEEVETKASKTASAIRSEIEVADSVEKYDSERDAREFKKFLEYCWMMVNKYGKSSDEEPITTDYKVDGKNVDGITRGDVLASIKKTSVNFVVDSLSAIKENKTGKISLLQALIQNSGGDPVLLRKLVDEIGKLMGFNLSEQDVQQSQGQLQQTLPVPTQEAQL